MFKILGLAISLALVAVAGFDQDKSSCTAHKQTAAQASCSQQDHAAEAAKVRMAKLTEQLQLTDSQVVKVKAIFAESKAECAAVAAKFAPLMEEIHALKHSENPDYEAIKAKKAELMALKQQYAPELAAYRANLIAKVKAVLTSEQIAKLDRIQSEIFGDDLTVVASTR